LKCGKIVLSAAAKATAEKAAKAAGVKTPTTYPEMCVSAD
jgi:hypothetical protein